MRRILPCLIILVVASRGSGQSAVDPAWSESPRQPAAAPVPASTAPTESNSPEAQQPIRFDATWDNGLFLTSDDKQFRFHAGGRGQIDSVWLVGPQGNFVAPGGSTSGVGNAAATQIRRAELQMDGTIYGQFDFVVQYDFANANNENSGEQPPSFNNLTSAPAPKNVWVQMHDSPYLGIVRVGNQKKPIGMINNTSSADLPFMERPDNHDAFYAPFDSGYALGVAALNWSENELVTWHSGIYRPAINTFGVALNKYSVGGRVTALPLYEDDGERLIHVGFGTFDGQIVQNELRDRVRPVLRNAPGFAVPIFADTSQVPGNRQYTIGPEFAAVYGSWTIQSEWAGQFLTHAVENNQPQGTVFFQGGYAEVMYFLTGEHDNYEKQKGVFGRVIPRSNFQTKAHDCCRGLGAWQVGVRFSYVDLNDKAIQGGQVYDWTVGVNWYLNPNMKMQFNYVAEHRDDPSAGVNGWINGFGIRAAYDF
jgi:phosphate-selective porin OprO/OprP